MKLFLSRHLPSLLHSCSSWWDMVVQGRTRFPWLPRPPGRLQFAGRTQTALVCMGALGTPPDRGRSGGLVGRSPGRGASPPLLLPF